MSINSFFIKVGDTLNPVPKETLARVDALQAKVADFQSLRGPLLERFTTGLDPGQTLVVQREYMRFMILAAVSDKPLAPPLSIGNIHREHIKFSGPYWNEFCQRTLERDVHNNPGGFKRLGQLNGAYKDTINFYRRVFGTNPPEDIWQPPKERCKEIKSVNFYVAQGEFCGKLDFKDLLSSHSVSSNPTRRVVPRSKDGAANSPQEIVERIMLKLKGKDGDLAKFITKDPTLERWIKRSFDFNGHLPEVLNEYLKYMAIVSVAEFPTRPSAVISTVVRAHKVFTKLSHDELNINTLGRDTYSNDPLVTANSKFAGMTTKQRYDVTLALYREIFGTDAPERYWGADRCVGGARSHENPLADTPEEAADKKRLREERLSILGTSMPITFGHYTQEEPQVYYDQPAAPKIDRTSGLMWEDGQYHDRDGSVIP